MYSCIILFYHTVYCKFLTAMLLVKMIIGFFLISYSFLLPLFLLLVASTIQYFQFNVLYTLIIYRMNFEFFFISFQEGNEFLLSWTCQCPPYPETLWFFWGRSPLLACFGPCNPCVCFRTFIPYPLSRISNIILFKVKILCAPC